jgi:hypothetical protein
MRMLLWLLKLLSGKGQPVLHYERLWRMPGQQAWASYMV